LKKGLKNTFRGFKTKIKTDGDRYGEDLKIAVFAPGGRNNACFRFRHDQASNNLAGFMDIVEWDGRKETSRRSYSFSDVTRMENIPGFSEEEINLLKTAFLYTRENDKIVTVIDPQIQAQIYIEAIGQAFPDIMREIIG